MLLKNAVWQYFSGQDYYSPVLPCDTSQVGRFCTAIGEVGLEKLLKVTIDTAGRTKVIFPAEFKRVLGGAPLILTACAR